ncbi:50S ribosomal protein L10 [Gemmatimonadota bacterium]
MNVVEAERSHDEELQDLQRPPRPEKVAEVERLEGVLKDSASVFLTDFRGIDVAMMNDLRGRFREADVQFKIVKNNLLIRAADNVELPGWMTDLEGPTAMAVSLADPVAPARVIKSFQDDHRRRGDFLVFKGGLLEGEIIEQSMFVKLASLPSREELLSRLVWIISSPLQGLVNVLTGVPRALVTALDDLRKKRESGEIANPASPESQSDQIAGPESEAAAEEPEADQSGDEPVDEAGEESAEETSAESSDVSGADEESEEVKDEASGEGDADTGEPDAAAPVGESDASEESQDADPEVTADQD